jgi:alpha-glucosidase (family GH31 glycosyl hydrolase)
MDAFADFSVDATAFPNLATWTAALHAANRKLTVIIDAGLSAESPENQYYVTAA